MGVQKVVKAVFEEEVKKNCGDVRLCNGFVHRGVVCCQEGGDQPATIISRKRGIFRKLYLARASLVLPRGGSRTPQVVVTAAREGGLVSKVESWRRGKFERRGASQGFHLCKPWDDAVSSGLDHCLLSVDLLLRWSLFKWSFIITISVVGTNNS